MKKLFSLLALMIATVAVVATGYTLTRPAKGSADTFTETATSKFMSGDPVEFTEQSAWAELRPAGYSICVNDVKISSGGNTVTLGHLTIKGVTLGDADADGYQSFSFSGTATVEGADGTFLTDGDLSGVTVEGRINTTTRKIYMVWKFKVYNNSMDVVWTFGVDPTSGGSESGGTISVAGTYTGNAVSLISDYSYDCSGKTVIIQDREDGDKKDFTIQNVELASSENHYDVGSFFVEEVSLTANADGSQSFSFSGNAIVDYPDMTVFSLTDESTVSTSAPVTLTGTISKDGKLNLVLTYKYAGTTECTYTFEQITSGGSESGETTSGAGTYEDKASSRWSSYSLTELSDTKSVVVTANSDGTYNFSVPGIALPNGTNSFISIGDLTMENVTATSNEDGSISYSFDSTGKVTNYSNLMIWGNTETPNVTMSGKSKDGKLYMVLNFKVYNFYDGVYIFGEEITSGGSTTEPDAGETTVAGTVVGTDGYAPAGSTFVEPATIDWETQKLVVSIDVSGCTGTNENILSIGDGISAWSGTHFHFYYTKNSSSNNFQINYLGATAGAASRKDLTITDSEIVIEISKENGLVINGEAANYGYNTTTTATPSELYSELFALSSIQIGSQEGNNRSNATYNYMRVQDLETETPETPTAVQYKADAKMTFAGNNFDLTDQVIEITETAENTYTVVYKSLTAGTSQIGDFTAEGVTGTTDENGTVTFTFDGNAKVTNVNSALASTLAIYGITEGGTTPFKMEGTLTDGTLKAKFTTTVLNQEVAINFNEYPEEVTPTEPTDQSIEINTATGSLGTYDASLGNFASRWSSTQTEPQISLVITKTDGTEANNVKVAGSNETTIQAYVGAGSDYTLSISDGWVITGYSFDFALVESGTNVTVTANGETKTATDATQSVEVTGLEESSVVAFSLAGANKGLNITNWKVTYKQKATEPVTPSYGPVTYSASATVEFGGTTSPLTDQTVEITQTAENTYTVVYKNFDLGSTVVGDFTAEGVSGSTDADGNVTYEFDGTAKVTNINSDYSWILSAYYGITENSEIPFKMVGTSKDGVLKAKFTATIKSSDAVVNFNGYEEAVTPDTPTDQSIEINTATGSLGTYDASLGNFASRWSSTQAEPQISLVITKADGTEANNVYVAGSNETTIQAYVGAGSDYTLSISDGWVITGYSFDFALTTSGTTVTVTANGETKTATDATQSVEVTGLEESSVVAFSLAGDNKGLNITNWKVTYKQKASEPETKPATYEADAKVSYSGTTVDVTDQTVEITETAENTYTVVIKGITVGSNTLGDLTVEGVSGTLDEDGYINYSIENGTAVLSNVDTTTGLGFYGLIKEGQEFPFSMVGKSKDGSLVAKFTTEYSNAEVVIAYNGYTEETVDPDPEVEGTKVGTDNYEPAGTAFTWETDINWENQKLVASIDVTGCSSAEHECLLDVGNDIDQWKGTGYVNFHLYYTRSSQAAVLWYNETDDNRLQDEKSLTGDEVIIEISKENGIVINGESWNQAESDFATAYANFFALDHIQVGSAEGNTRSNAKYNYIRVQDIEKDPETAINDFNAAVANGKADIYTINGVKVNALQKGINIVRVNGKTMKVVKK